MVIKKISYTFQLSAEFLDQAGLRLGASLFLTRYICGDQLLPAGTFPNRGHTGQEGHRTGSWGMWEVRNWPLLKPEMEKRSSVPAMLV